jgi:hypothetical protein
MGTFSLILMVLFPAIQRSTHAYMAAAMACPNSCINWLVKTAQKIIGKSEMGTVTPGILREKCVSKCAFL